MSSGSGFTTNRYKRKLQGTKPSVPAPPARLAGSALRGQGKGGEELGKRRGGRDGRREEAWGSPGFPALRNAGISTAAPPRSARTHAREARERPPRHREGPRRRDDWLYPASRAHRGSPWLPPTVPRPCALTPQRATPVSPLAVPAPPPHRMPDAARGRPTVAGTLPPAYRQSQCRPCP